jgi:8-oxo-dGTP pyrophosphatase MutT (NUDIX family)
MYVKIYFNDKPLYLCNDIDASIQPWVHLDDTVFIDELNIHTVKTMIHEMQQPAVHAGVFYHDDIEVLKKAFWKRFSLVKAAGGVVFNEKNEVLLIFRRGKWDLPKGKLDKGESPEECVIRETEEETGVKNLVIERELGTTYHTYHEGARFKLKETTWFKLKSQGIQMLKPQANEDIHEVKWITPAALKNYIQISFPLVHDVLQLALKPL